MQALIVASAAGAIALCALILAALLLRRLLKDSARRAHDGQARRDDPFRLDDDPPGTVPPAQEAAAPPPEAPRLEAHLLSPQAPGRLRLPVRLEPGRMLEVDIPIALSWTGAQHLYLVHVVAVLPRALVDEASLERLVAELRPGREDARAEVSHQGATSTLTFVLARLAGGAQVSLPIPICLTAETSGAFELRLSVDCAAMDAFERRYLLEPIPPDRWQTEPREPGIWICAPDEESRMVDPELPLDRIASMKFLVYAGAAG